MHQPAVLGVPCLVVTKRLLSSRKVPVLVTQPGVLGQDVVHHRFILVWQKQPQTLTQSLQTERVHGPYGRLALVRGIPKAFSNVCVQLLGYDAVEGHHQHS